MILYRHALNKAALLDLWLPATGAIRLVRPLIWWSGAGRTADLPVFRGSITLKTIVAQHPR
jgi:hypothetical protein